MVKRLLAWALAFVAFAFQPLAAEATAPTIYCAEGTLTGSEADHLNTAPVTLVAAQGANTIIRVIKAFITVTPTGLAFNSDCAPLSIQYTGGTFASTIKTYSSVDHATIYGARALSAGASVTTDIRNTAVQLKNTAGDNSSGGPIAISYRVIYYVAQTNH